MGVVYREVDLPDVLSILKQRGYGQVTSRRYGLALNRATGERWQSGGEKRETIGGITREQLSTILRHSETAEQAANMIESTILGKEMLPVDTARANSASGNGLTTEVVEKLVTNRVANEVQKCLTPVYSQMQEMMAQMKATADAVNQSISTVRKGRKKKSVKEQAAEELVKMEDLPKNGRSADVGDAW